MEKGEHLKRQNRPTMLQLQYLQGLSKVEKKTWSSGKYRRILWREPINGEPLF